MKGVSLLSLISTGIYRRREAFQDLLRDHMRELKSEVVETISDAEWQAIDEAEMKIMTAVSVQADELVDGLERDIQLRFDVAFKEADQGPFFPEGIDMNSAQAYLVGMVRAYAILDLPLPEGAEYYQ